METVKTPDSSTSSNKEPTKSYEDAHASVPMVGFVTSVGVCEAFEYISLSRATMNRARDSIQLFFAPATVTISLKDSADRKKDAKRLELFRAFLAHSVQWVNSGSEIVSDVSVQITEQQEFGGMEIEETENT